ncbi:hypothetical protein TWF788_006735 [Orbilia oligospora]|uniref:Uncharacterized protein n=1 Tax=Orbilia oligospora TaxID=2813651 RepID=A0A7C8PVB5_ORBOL|nr:hypothetical protein TWF788_006735 [Orbilia oligospora]
MAESDTGFYPIAALYETHPHVLTDIMYYCTPTTFDAFRYTCKAVYSMSLDPDLLEHHLKIIVNRQHELVSTLNIAPRFYYDVIYMDSKFDTIQNSHGNLWRLRGRVLQEFLRMRSSWRIGDYKKVVVELDVHPEGDNEVGNTSENGQWFDGTVQIFSGAVRGDTFAVSWSDTKQTHIHTYLFTNAQKYAICKLEGPMKTSIHHSFSENNTYRSTTFKTKSVAKRRPQSLSLNINKKFDIFITEGSYLRNPHMSTQDDYLARLYGTIDTRELLSTFLRVAFDGKYVGQSDDDEGPVDLAYELDWDQRRSWKVPATDLSNAPNVTLPGHCDEAMNLLLGKNGKCESKGYAIGLDSRPHQKWKIHEPRRLKEDVSRLGVWRDVSVEFERGQDGKEAILRVLATISKNLIKPNPQKRFLLTNSKILNPDDWADVQIPLVLPPVTREDRHGQLVLATVAPAAYFRRLGMRDPHIPWADKGFMDYNWDTKKNAEGEVGTEPIFIRTGVFINSELVDAEIVTRIVGWTDDGAVWVWDVTEKHILDAGELSMEQNPSQVLDVTAKKLGYVKDVKGIFATGDRLVQRITLVTYGEEQKVHGVGEEHGGGNDSGILSLRQEDITRKINEAKAKKAAGEQEEFKNGHGDSDGYGEASAVPQLEATNDLADDTRRWRMINYCYGYPKGGGSATYRIDHSGDIEDI